MVYDLTQELDRQSFKARANALFKRKAKVELTDKTKRTGQQNRYLHLILGWFALQYGSKLEYVKVNYFKRLVNPDIFITYEEDQFLGRTEVIRSSAKLNEEEMTIAITRFRDWSSQEAGIYLPSSDERESLDRIEYETEKYKKYL